jgi:hypothetical protein
MITRKVRARPLAALLCDDIRREASGKFIVIGGYDTAMVLEDFPFEGKIAILLIVELLEEGETLIDVELSYPDADGMRRKIVMRGGGEAVDLQGQKEVAMIELTSLPFKIHEPGEIQVSARIDGGDWALLRTLHAQKADVATAE